MILELTEQKVADKLNAILESENLPPETLDDIDHWPDGRYLFLFRQPDGLVCGTTYDRLNEDNLFDIEAWLNPKGPNYTLIGWWDLAESSPAKKSLDKAKTATEEGHQALARKMMEHFKATGDLPPISHCMWMFVRMPNGEVQMRSFEVGGAFAEALRDDVLQGPQALVALYCAQEGGCWADNLELSGSFFPGGESSNEIGLTVTPELQEPDLEKFDLDA